MSCHHPSKLLFPPLTSHITLRCSNSIVGQVQVMKDVWVGFFVLVLLFSIRSDALPGWGRAWCALGFLWAEIATSSRDALQQEFAFKWHASYERLQFLTIGIFLTKKGGGKKVKKLLPALVWYIYFFLEWTGGLLCSGDRMGGIWHEGQKPWIPRGALAWTRALFMLGDGHF